MPPKAPNLTGYKVDEDPQPDQDVELLCMDSFGAFNLQFLCRRQNVAWVYAQTGRALDVDALGWRLPRKSSPRWTRRN